jgi:hypothetical protein
MAAGRQSRNAGGRKSSRPLCCNRTLLTVSDAAQRASQLPRQRCLEAKRRTRRRSSLKQSVISRVAKVSSSAAGTVHSSAIIYCAVAVVPIAHRGSAGRPVSAIPGASDTSAHISHHLSHGSPSRCQSTRLPSLIIRPDSQRTPAAALLSSSNPGADSLSPDPSR